jgi:hypothetical protein
MMRQAWDYGQWIRFGSHAGQPGHRHGVQKNTEKLIGSVPLLFTEKFEVVIMIAVTDRVPDLNLDCERAGVGKGNGMAAILRASERRTIVGLIPLASELS